MNERIEIKVNYTADDYARGLRYIQKRSFLFFLPLLLPLIVISGFSLILFLSNPQNFYRAFSKPEGFLPVLIPIVILLPFFYFLKLRKKSSFLIRKQYERQIKSSPALQETKTIIFDEKGLKGQQNLGSGETSWDAFIEATETEDDFYFFTAKKTAQFIPKRTFESEFQQHQLRDLAKRKLGDKAKF